MEVFKKGYNNRYFPFLINAQFNFCDVATKKNYLPYAIMLWKVMKQYTNANHSCPLTVKQI